MGVFSQITASMYNNNIFYNKITTKNLKTNKFISKHPEANKNPPNNNQSTKLNKLITQASNKLVRAIPVFV